MHFHVVSHKNESLSLILSLLFLLLLLLILLLLLLLILLLLLYINIIMTWWMFPWGILPRCYNLGSRIGTAIYT